MVCLTVNRGWPDGASIWATAAAPARSHLWCKRCVGLDRSEFRSNVSKVAVSTGAQRVRDPLGQATAVLETAAASFMLPTWTLPPRRMKHLRQHLVSPRWPHAAADGARSGPGASGPSDRPRRAGNGCGPCRIQVRPPTAVPDLTRCYLTVAVRLIVAGQLPPDRRAAFSPRNGELPVRTSAGVRTGPPDRLPGIHQAALVAHLRQRPNVFSTTVTQVHSAQIDGSSWAFNPEVRSLDRRRPGPVH